MEKDKNIELTRITAAIFVVVLHCAAAFFENAKTFNAANFWDSFVRSAVPLFFMASGVCLIIFKKDEPLFSYIKKRAKKILPPLFFWAFFAVIITSHGQYNLLQILKKMFLTFPYFHLWYLYALVGLYLLVPIIKKWYFLSDNKEKLFYIGLWIIAGSYGSLSNSFFFKYDLNQLYYLSLFANYAGFFVLGAFLYEIINKHKLFFQKYKFITVSLYFIVCILTMGLTYIATTYSKGPNVAFYDYLSLNTILATALMFTIINTLTFSSKLINNLSIYTLGIYCVHPFILELLPLAKINNFIGNTYITIPILSGIVLVVSFAVAFTLRKIPYIKNVI